MRIICVTKTAELRDRIRKLFSGQTSQADFEPNLDRVLERFETTAYDILLITSVAIREGEIDGLELLDVVRARSPGTQVLFLAEARDLKLAMSSLEVGAYQYATLPISDLPCLSGRWDRPHVRHENRPRREVSYAGGVQRHGDASDTR